MDAAFGGQINQMGKKVAHGGRVLAVTARGQSLQEAHSAAYAALRRITWPEGFFRSDIGWRSGIT